MIRARFVQQPLGLVFRRLCASVLGAALLCAAVPTHAAAPDSSEVERLYLQGQERMDESDYRGAAESWTRLLGVLPESGENQATRESVIISILDAYMKAYNGLVDESGNKDISHLRAAKTTLDRYYSDFKSTHGDRVAVSDAVQEHAALLERTLERAQDEQRRNSDTVPPPPPPDERKGDDGGKPKVVVVTTNNGTGLIVGGAVVAAMGLGALAMIPVGVVRGNTAEGDYERSIPGSPEQQRAEFDGHQADDILIAGAVLAPILLAGGSVMIAFGVKARKKWQRDQQNLFSTVRPAPVLTRSYAGFTLQGRF